VGDSADRHTGGYASGFKFNMYANVFRLGNVPHTLAAEAAEKPEDEGEEDAEKDGRGKRKINLGVAAAAAPVEISWKTSEGKTETRAEEHGGA
jgi:hypothetical protein